jgi:proline racemase
MIGGPDLSHARLTAVALLKFWADRSPAGTGVEMPPRDARLALLTAEPWVLV